MGIIAGIMALAGSVATAVAAKRAQKRQNRYNQQAADLAYQREQEAINQQNEYNSPQNQMERYKAAGLNPNLIYQQGTAGLQEAHASYTPPEQSFENYAGPAITSMSDAVFQNIAQYQALQLQGQQLENLRLTNERQSMDNELQRYELDYGRTAAFLRNRGLELDVVGKEKSNQLKQNELDTFSEKLASIKLKNELSEKQKQVMDKKLEEFDKLFRKLDDDHQTNLVQRAIMNIDYEMKQDEYEFGMELTRIQGRILQTDSFKDIPWTDVLKLIIYYAGSHFDVPFPRRSGAKDKGYRKETTNWDKDGHATKKIEEVTPFK